MALVISVKEGSSFFVDDTEVKMGEVKNSSRYVLEIDGAMIQKFTVDSLSRVEILPDVFVSAMDSPHYRVGKVVIEAPRKVNILRDKLYRGGSSEHR